MFNGTNSLLMKRLCFLIGFIASTLLADPLPKTTAERARQVEQNLIPYIPIEGFKPWSLTERMKFYRVPGLTIAVVRDYRVDWVRSYGLANTSTGERTLPSTIFSAGSVSKLANAMLMMKLVEEGKLQLDSPINEVLKDWKIPDNEFTQAKPITLRMLLSHSAGTTQAAFFGFQPEQKQLPTTLDTLRGVAPAENRGVGVNSAPGKEFRYSGGGTVITQFAAEQISGRAYSDLIQEKLFGPLRMKSTTMVQPLPASFEKRTAYPYSDATWFTGVPYIYPQVSAAGMFADSADIAQLLIEVQNALRGKGKVLSQKSAQEMIRAVVPISEGMFKEEMGAGPFLLQLKANKAGDGGRYFGHAGRNAGFLSEALASVEGGNGVVILCNNDGANDLLYEIRRSVAKVYGWTEFLPPAAVSSNPSAEKLLALTGRFRRANDEVVTFRQENGLLFQSINGGAEVICVPQAVNKPNTESCLLTDFGLTGEFQIDEKGRAQSFQVVGISSVMPRLSDAEKLPNELLRAGAREVALAAYRQQNLDVWTLTSMAGNYMSGGMLNYPAAQTLLDLALEKFPTQPIVYRNLAILALRQNDRERAKGYLDRTLALNPDDSEAKIRRQRLND
jgi:CubicO group peptidase (beta-lactamase class C family)